MTTTGQVHWHEGLFLQPHHLQTMQHESGEGLARERRLSWAFPYGLIDLRISTDGLENMLVRVDRLRAVMPSGLEVDAPGNADIPALDIKRVFQGGTGGFVVSLAVPLWQGGRGNTVEPLNGAVGHTPARAAVAQEVQVKRLFRVAEVTRFDENTGENAQPLLVRRVNARLIVEGEDTSDMELLPLLRIIHATDQESSLPRADKTFVPPCLVLGGSPDLRNMVRDLANFIEAWRKELASLITRAGFVVENLKPAQIIQIMRLRTLNRFAAILPQMVAGGVGGAGTTSPVTMYYLLRELQGELAALVPNRDPFFEAAKYDHDNPWPVFDEISRKIRMMREDKETITVLKVPFTRDGALLRSGPMTDEHFTRPNGYWLGIRTRMNPSELGRLVEDGSKFKLYAASKSRLNIFGVPLIADRFVPSGFPAGTDIHYFRLDPTASDTGKDRWSEIVSEKSACVRWLPGETFECEEVILYMSVP